MCSFNDGNGNCCSNLKIPCVGYSQWPDCVRCQQKSKQLISGRGIDFVLIKAEEGPYWPRLLKDTKKCHWLKVDFNKWKDEDESDDEGAGAGGGPGGPGGDMDIEAVRAPDIHG